MDLQSILAAILNPNGAQGAPQMAAQQVGDHNNPAFLQQAMVRAQQPQAPPQAVAPQQAPQPLQTPQSVPQAPPMPAQAPQQGGMGGLGGILQSIIAPQAAQKNKTVGWLTSQGIEPGMATVIASDKTALRQFILQRGQGQKPIEIAGRLVDPNTYKVLADFSDKGNKLQPVGKDSALYDSESKQWITPPKAAQAGYQLLTPEEIKSAGLPQGVYQKDGEGKITSVGGLREQDPNFSREQTLRQEYENNPNVKNYQIVRDNYERIRQGAQQSTGAGDLAIVFGYMKMLDPTSVVREGEQASAENTAGVPAAIRNTYNRIMSGDKLSPDARQQLLSAANQVYSQSAQNLGDLNTRYGGIAQNWQLDPTRVIQQPEKYDSMAPMGPQSGGLPLPPPQGAAPPAAGPPPVQTPPAAVPQSPTSPVVDWKDYFGKKAR